MQYSLKLVRIIQKLFIVGLGILFNIFIRVIRPIIHVRYGLLMSSRIGEIVTKAEIYLSKSCCDKNTRNIDIFFLEEQICNRQVIKMYSKLINMFPFHNISRGIAYVNKWFPDPGLYEIKTGRIEDFHLIFSRPNSINFNNEQSTFGKGLLYNLGIPEGEKYVCFFARDDAYLKTNMPERDWSYHNYRDADILNYVPALEMLVSLGYYLIRVGSKVNKRIDTNNEKIICYSTSKWQSEFMDIYLLSNCQFFIGDTSGLKIIPMIFRKPCVLLNLANPGDAIGFTRPEDLILFKKIWSIKKEGYLNLKEIINIGSDYCRTEYYEKNGLELIENTPEEIKDVVLEMASHIHGDIEYSSEDECLQDKFKSKLLEGYETDYVGRLGRNYLSQNKDWYLDQESNECV